MPSDKKKIIKKSDKKKNKSTKNKSVPLSDDAYSIEKACDYLNVGKELLNKYIEADFLPVYREKYDMAKNFKKYFLKKDLDKIKRERTLLVLVEREPEPEPEVINTDSDDNVKEDIDEQDDN